MSLLLKLTSISIAGIGILGASVLITVYAEGEPEWRSLSEDSEFSPSKGVSPYESGYGKKYSRFFLGAGTSKLGASQNINNSYWWNKKYELFSEKKPTSGRFKDVNKAYGNEETSLSKVCDDAYRTKESDIAYGRGQKDTNQFNEEEVWKFCSFGGTKIKTIEEYYASNNPYNGTTHEKYGKKYASDLVAPDGNDWFWNIRHQDLISLLGNPATIGSKFRVPNHRKMTLSHIKNECKEAYGQKEEGINYPKADLYKFCSLSGIAPRT